MRPSITTYKNLINYAYVVKALFFVFQRLLTLVVPLQRN